ncbi:MAG TPA: tetratricopeptide repeat protein [Candidatus Acidoferrum sp.]|nr:tetratricopeptide repeat protein [Candidatus Acidoferrum sp.]
MRPAIRRCLPVGLAFLFWAAVARPQQPQQTNAALRDSELRTSEKLNAAMHAGLVADSQSRHDEAIKSYKEAVALAEQLRPRDQRLAAALDHLGNRYLGRDFPAADAAYSRELKVVEELFGLQNPNVAQPLQSLGTSALLQKDYASAQKFYTRALEANEKGLGVNSPAVADSLRILARVFVLQKQYGRAEPYLLRAVKIDESASIQNDSALLGPLTMLCNLYEVWGKPDKAEPREREIIGIVERQYGPDNQILVPVLTKEAQSLRSLGRADEATKVEQRLKSIQSTAMN